jgi:peptidoglycan/xylan/chitin deacetylase (PgdA/CDA1 family)
VRGEPIHLVDGGDQKRSFADVSDGIDALQTIIANPGGVASGRIYNIGNPANHHSVRELAEMMLAMASDFPEYAESASRCRIVETPAVDFYGRATRTSAIGLPKIAATMAELQWRPKIDMTTALRRIFDSYRGHVVEARALARSGRLGLLAVALIALKVDVDTLRGTQEGVPRLLRLLERANVRRTFLFSVGPDHTGWALRRALRPGFLSKVSRTSVVSHYGLRTLLYGLLLPGPDIGKVAAEPMRSALRAGHECGLHAWDHVLWQDKVRHRDAAWTVRQMELAFDRFVDVFGRPPSSHGAAGWQMNAAAFRQIDRWGLDLCLRRPRQRARSSRRRRARRSGTCSCRPRCRRWTSLLGSRRHRRRQRGAPPAGPHRPGPPQVHTLHAELEGRALASVFSALVRGWQDQGHRLGTLDDAYRSTTLRSWSGKRWTGAACRDAAARSSAPWTKDRLRPLHQTGRFRIFARTCADRIPFPA